MRILKYLALTIIVFASLALLLRIVVERVKDKELAHFMRIMTCKEAKNYMIDIEKNKNQWRSYFGTNVPNIHLTVDEYYKLFPAKDHEAHPDPWGNSYRVILNIGNDEFIICGKEKIKEVAVVWSCGPNGIDENGSGDDLVSWRH